MNSNKLHYSFKSARPCVCSMNVESGQSSVGLFRGSWGHHKVGGCTSMASGQIRSHRGQKPLLFLSFLLVLIHHSPSWGPTLSLCILFILVSRLPFIFGVLLGPVPSGGTASVLSESSRILSVKGLLPLQVSLTASAQAVSPQASAMSDSELHGLSSTQAGFAANTAHTLVLSFFVLWFS